MSGISQQGKASWMIMLGILGILAAITIPNAVNFITTSRLSAANTELQNVKTAAVAFMSEHEGTWPADESRLSDYLSGELAGEYSFNTATGLVMSATGWNGLAFDPESQSWQKSP